MSDELPSLFPDDALTSRVDRPALDWRDLLPIFDKLGAYERAALIYVARQILNTQARHGLYDPSSDRGSMIGKRCAGLAEDAIGKAFAEFNEEAALHRVLGRLAREDG